MFGRSEKWTLPVSGDETKADAKLITNALAAGKTATRYNADYLGNIVDNVDRLLTRLHLHYPKIDLADILNNPTDRAIQNQLLEDILATGADKNGTIFEAATTLWESLGGQGNTNSVGVFVRSRIEQPMMLLSAYDLAKAITPLDDPYLWAAIISYYWLVDAVENNSLSAALDNPANFKRVSWTDFDSVSELLADLTPTDLVWGAGTYLYEITNNKDVDGLTESWHLKTDINSITAQPWLEEHQTSFTYHDHQGLNELRLSRPSCDGRPVTVRFSNIQDVRSGMGSDILWVRATDGSWRPDKLLAEWIS